MKIYKCVKTKQNKTPPFKLGILSVSQRQIQKEWEEEPETEEGLEPDSLNWRGKVKGKFSESPSSSRRICKIPPRETG